MQKLFLAAIMVSVGATAIMAQEANKTGILNLPSNLRFEISDTDKQEIQREPLKSRGAGIVTPGRAQCPPRCAGGDRTNFELYVGYSFLRFDGFDTDADDIDDFLRESRNFNGVEVSGTFNFSRYVGAQVDFSYHKKSDLFTDGGPLTEVDASIQNYLFGIQVKDNSIDGPWFRPFGHFLAGFSRQRLELEGATLPPADLTFRRTSFALAMGGGLDIRLTDHVSVRAIKFDYLPVFVDDSIDLGVVFDGRTQNNFRAGAGLVFKF
jgi:opacity protein-like surface antigen